MSLTAEGQYVMNAVVFGVSIGNNKSSVCSLKRSASAKTGFPALGSSIKVTLPINGDDVAVKFTVTGEFSAAADIDMAAAEEA